MAELVVKKDGSLEAVYEKVVKDGQGVEPITYNGRQVGLMGYASKRDREVQLEMLSSAMESASNIHEAVNMLNKIAQCVDKEIVPDETVEVSGVNVTISYKDKKTYLISTSGVETLADLSELNLPSIGKEALKELLVKDTERALLAKKEAEEKERRKCRDYDGDYDDYDDYDDDGDCDGFGGFMIAR